MTKAVVVKLDDALYKLIVARAKKNFLEIDEMIEDIIRRSMLSYKKNGSSISDKVDDSLVGVFSRKKRGKQRK
jgi:hypothetical protein